MKPSLRIGIIGDYRPGDSIHTATDAALGHAAAGLGTGVDLTWIPTPTFAPESGPLVLQDYDALWGSAGSPYASMQGALNAIRFARERHRPFFGT
jgi:CTP synthase (UTP-ammonia lyase)